MEEKMKAATIAAKPTSAVNGQLLLQSFDFDRRMCALAILTRPDEEQEQLLATIVVNDQRKNVTAALAAFRSALGLPAF
jgi:hypothetical protein